MAEGDKICKEMLMSNSSQIEYLICTQDWLKENTQSKEFSFEILTVENTSELKGLTKLSTPSSVLLVANFPEIKESTSVFSIYLDGIQDPGNMGTILRIADWYGIQTIYLSKDCVDVFNRKSIQASMGSFLRVGAISRGLEEMDASRFNIVGATMRAKSSAFEQTHKQTLLVIGNEGSGIRNQNLNLLHQEIGIESHRKLGAESLNAAVATAVLCDRFFR